jgi:hypothetical protein
MILAGLRPRSAMSARTVVGGARVTAARTRSIVGAVTAMCNGAAASVARLATAATASRSAFLPSYKSAA